jgi:hypothetical protein
MSSSDASTPRHTRASVLRLSTAASLVLFALFAPKMDRRTSAQACGSCPEVCGESECSCGVFACGSAEFCSLTGNADPCQYPGGCPSGEVYYNGCCATLGTPILIDLAGDGLDLTNLSAGVLFPIAATPLMYKVSWTEPGMDDSWLVLDRNENGRIDNGTELFGNFTPQPEPPAGQSKNGYLALAVFDETGSGGNHDGLISAGDKIFSTLRLWRDANHNGESEPGELTTLTAAGVLSISLEYRESKHRDAFGNVFRYRAPVTMVRNGRTQQTESVDVFLKVTRNTT